MHRRDTEEASRWALHTLKEEGLYYEPMSKSRRSSGHSWESGSQDTRGRPRKKKVNNGLGKFVRYPERDPQRAGYVQKWSSLDPDSRVEVERSLAQEVGHEWRTIVPCMAERTPEGWEQGLVQLLPG